MSRITTGKGLYSQAELDAVSAVPLLRGLDHAMFLLNGAAHTQNPIARNTRTFLALQRAVHALFDDHCVRWDRDNPDELVYVLDRKDVDSRLSNNPDETALIASHIATGFLAHPMVRNEVRRERPDETASLPHRLGAKVVRSVRHLGNSVVDGFLEAIPTNRSQALKFGGRALILALAAPGGVFVKGAAVAVTLLKPKEQLVGGTFKAISRAGTPIDPIDHDQIPPGVLGDQRVVRFGEVQLPRPNRPALIRAFLIDELARNVSAKPVADLERTFRKDISRRARELDFDLMNVKPDEISNVVEGMKRDGMVEIIEGREIAGAQREARVRVTVPRKMMNAKFIRLTADGLEYANQLRHSVGYDLSASAADSTGPGLELSA